MEFSVRCGFHCEFSGLVAVFYEAIISLTWKRAAGLTCPPFPCTVTSTIFSLLQITTLPLSSSVSHSPCEGLVMLIPGSVLSLFSGLKCLAVYMVVHTCNPSTQDTEANLVYIGDIVSRKGGRQQDDSMG
jgi:hypothetical protein